MPDVHTDPALGPELNTAADGIALTEPHTEPANSPRRLQLYCAILMVVPFLYMTICFLLMRSDYIVKRTQYTYLANMGYGLKLHHADCDVVIYGDSSAMIGIDPGILKRDTGLSTCNIADFAGMLRLNGTMVLDEYLKNNVRPKYLVILMAPEDLAMSWRHDANYEAVLTRVRFRPDLEFFYALMRHADDVLSAIGVTGRFALTDLVRHPLAPSVFHQREELRGRFPDPTERMVVCPKDVRDNPPSKAWLDGLRTKYGIDGTRVIVDMVPVPACDPALNTYRTRFAPGNGIIDNRLEIYPLNWYTQSGRLHLGAPEGWQHLSGEVANQLEQLERAGGIH